MASLKGINPFDILDGDEELENIDVLVARLLVKKEKEKFVAENEVKENKKKSFVETKNNKSSSDLGKHGSGTPNKNGVERFNGHKKGYGQNNGRDNGYRQSNGRDSGYKQPNGRDSGYRQNNGRDSDYNQNNGRDNGSRQPNGRGSGSICSLMAVATVLVSLFFVLYDYVS